MPRSGPSAADSELIRQLADRGKIVSLSQLERWRSAGLLPRHLRHGRGRGKGSTSATAPGAVEVAAVLADHARQGRDLRLAVVDWFATAGLQIPGAAAVPEPPDAALCAAMRWVAATSPAYRLLQMARSAQTETQIDDFYQAAGHAVSRVAGPAALDTAAVRHALLTGQDPAEGIIQAEPSAVRSAIVQLIAAAGLGYEEVPAELLAEAVVGTGLYPRLARDDWVRAATEQLRAGASGDPAPERLYMLHDPLALVEVADAEQLRRARTVAHGLSGIGALYLLHALLMPDTPGLAALRTLIDELGLGQMLMTMARGIDNTRGFADCLIACLHPVNWAIHELLSDHVATGPPLFHGPDDERTAEKYMADWISAIQSIGTAS